MINKNNSKITFSVVLCLFLGGEFTLAQSKIPSKSERIEAKREDISQNPRMQIKSKDELFQFMFPGSKGRPNDITFNGNSATPRVNESTSNRAFTSSSNRLPSDFSAEEVLQQESIKNSVKTGTTKEPNPNGSR